MSEKQPGEETRSEGATTAGGLLEQHDPISWRFYTYGLDEHGDPLFSFWMNIAPNTGVCIYDRNAGAGKWLSTRHSDDDYEGQPPSDELKAVLRDIVGAGGSVDGDRVQSLPDHEEYFFRVVHGTIDQKGKAPNELMAFLMEVAGTELELVELNDENAQSGERTEIATDSQQDT